MGGGIGVMITSGPASVGGGIGGMTSDVAPSGGAGMGVGVASPQPARPIASANAAVRTSAGVEGKGVSGGVKGESWGATPRSLELLTRAKIAATVAEGEVSWRYIRAVPILCSRSVRSQARTSRGGRLERHHSVHEATPGKSREATAKPKPESSGPTSIVGEVLKPATWP